MVQSRYICRRFCLRLIVLILFLVCLFPLLRVGTGADEETSKAKHIQDLIEDLASDDWQTREEATQELWRIGEPAREAMESAIKSPDAEVRLRARLILNRVQYGVTPEVYKRIGNLLAGFEDQAGNEQVRIIRQLQSSGGDLAFGVLEKIARHPLVSPEARKKALEILSSHLPARTIPILEKILQEEQSVWVYEMLAQSYEGDNNHKKAVATLEKALEITSAKADRSENTRIRENLVRLHWYLRDWEKVVKHLEFLIEHQRGKSLVLYYRQLAEAFSQWKKTQQAIQAWEKLIELKPGEEDYYLNLIRLFKQSRDKDVEEKILEVCRQGIEKIAHSIRLPYECGRIHLQKGELDKGFGYFIQALGNTKGKENPYYYPLQREIIYVFKQIGQPLLARPGFVSAFLGRPEKEKVCQELGQRLMEKGLTDEAFLFFKKALVVGHCPGSVRFSYLKDEWLKADFQTACEKKAADPEADFYGIFVKEVEAHQADTNRFPVPARVQAPAEFKPWLIEPPISPVFSIESRPVIKDGIIYYPTGKESSLVAVSLKDGQEKWRFTPPQSETKTIKYPKFSLSWQVKLDKILVTDKFILVPYQKTKWIRAQQLYGLVYAGYRIFALDKETGEIAWERYLRGYEIYPSRYQIGLAQDLLWTSIHSRVYILETTTGKIINSFEVNDTFLINESTLYSFDKSSRLVAFDIRTGEIKWQGELRYPFNGSPIIAGEYIFYVDKDWALVCVDAGSGATLWRCPDYGRGLTPLTVSADMVFTTGKDECLWAIDKKTGKIAWKRLRRKDGQWYSSILKDDVLYLFESRLGGMVDVRTGKTRRTEPLVLVREPIEDNRGNIFAVVRGAKESKKDKTRNALIQLEDYQPDETSGLDMEKLYQVGLELMKEDKGEWAIEVLQTVRQSNEAGFPLEGNLKLALMEHGQSHPDTCIQHLLDYFYGQPFNEKNPPAAGLHLIDELSLQAANLKHIKARYTFQDTLRNGSAEAVKKIIPVINESWVGPALLSDFIEHPRLRQGFGGQADKDLRQAIALKMQREGWPVCILQKAKGVYLDILENKEDTKEREQALVALGRILEPGDGVVEDKEMVGHLKEILSDKDTTIALKTAIVLDEWKVPVPDEIFLKGLSLEDVNLRHTSAKILAHRDNQKGVEALLKDFRSERKSSSPLALNALCEMGETSALSEIIEYIKQQDYSDYYAIMALGWMGDKEIIPPLSRVIKESKCYFARKQAAFYLYLFDEPESCAALEEYYDRMVEIDPDDLTVRHELGTILTTAKKYPKAIEQFQRMLERDPAHFDAWMHLAIVYKRNGQPEEHKRYREKVEQILQQVFKVYPDNPEYYYHAAWFYKEIKELDRALELSKKSVEFKPEGSAYLWILGEIYEARGEIDKAVESYKKAIKSRPTSIFIGAVRYRLKRLESR